MISSMHYFVQMAHEILFLLNHIYKVQLSFSFSKTNHTL
jgi:hypothetical protein